MKILVTGGAGYIGSFMVKRLLEAGDDVVVLDNLERGHRETIPGNVKFLKGDILDENFLEEVMSQDSYKAIIHFAGLISMEESVKNPFIYFKNNTFGGLNLINQGVMHGVKSFIFSSTAGVYGNPTKIPIPETHVKHPTNPYGESKLMFENILSWYKKIYSISFASLRYFNAAGASFDGNLGENHFPETHIIPLAVKAVLEDREFNLYGVDYETRDGTCIRDYIHVIDLVEAHVLALEKLKSDPGGYFYNVGTGNGYSNREILETVGKVSRKQIKINIAPRRLGDAEELIADATLIKKDLGFRPKHSDIETIVKTAWEWHRKNLKLKI